MHVDVRYEDKDKGGRLWKSRDVSSISNQISEPSFLRGVKDVPEKDAHKHSSRKITCICGCEIDNLTEISVF